MGQELCPSWTPSAQQSLAHSCCSGPFACSLPSSCLFQGPIYDFMILKESTVHKLGAQRCRSVEI